MRVVLRMMLHDVLGLRGVCDFLGHAYATMSGPTGTRRRARVQYVRVARALSLARLVDSAPPTLARWPPGRAFNSRQVGLARLSSCSSSVMRCSSRLSSVLSRMARAAHHGDCGDPSFGNVHLCNSITRMYQIKKRHRQSIGRPAPVPNPMSFSFDIFGFSSNCWFSV